jgi:hypothetical protein
MEKMKSVLGFLTGILGLVIAVYLVSAPSVYSSGPGLNTLFMPFLTHPELTEGMFVYGSPEDERFVMSRQTADGGLIVLGHPIAGIFYEAIQVIKFDSARAVQWHQQLDSDGTTVPGIIQETADSGFILAFEDTTNGYVVKLGSDGTVEWKRRYSESLNGNYLLQNVIQTSDGGYLATGYFLNELELEGAVLKLAANGDIQWQKSYEGDFNDFLVFAMETVDGYFVSGSTSDSGILPSDMDGWVMKLQSNGNMVWQKSYGGDVRDTISFLQPTPDGNLLAVGQTTSFGNDIEAWVLKLTADGSILWQKRYGGPGADFFYQIKPTPDGGYLAVGSFTPDGATHSDGWVVKLNGDGTIAWQKLYGGEGVDFLMDIYALPDNTWLATGTTNSVGAGSYDFWALPLTSDGTLIGCPGGVNGNGQVMDTAVTPLTIPITTQSPTFSISASSLVSQGMTGESAFACVP